MARAIFSSVLLSGAVPFLRTRRLGWGLVCHVLVVHDAALRVIDFPQLGPRLFVVTTRLERKFLTFMALERPRTPISAPTEGGMDSLAAAALLAAGFRALPLLPCQ
jgi:hypothetical protein